MSDPQATPSHPEPSQRGAGVAKWGVLAVLAAAQFLMVLDQAVMNVAISQLVEDFDTTVTTIQAVIALYALVMAGLMLTGGKLGDIWGRRRAFAVGLCIYGVGSALTAASWSVPSLTLGWSVLEGIGAALVLPAMVALVAAQLRGQGPRGRLRRARRRRRRRDRRRADPRRLGDDRAELARRLRRRGRRRDRHPLRDAVDPRARARAGNAAARLGRRRALGRRPGHRRARRPAGEQLGLAAAAQLADRALRLLADPVRDRRRRPGPRRLRRLGAAPRGAGRGPARPPAAAADPLAARRRLDAARPEPDPDGDLLHRAALPADRPGPRRARDRGAHAARLGRPLRRRPRRLGAGQRFAPRPSSASASRSSSSRPCCCWARSSRSSTTPPSWSRWACSASAWA